MTDLHTRLVGTEIIVLDKNLLPVAGPLAGPKQLGEGLHPSSFTGDCGVSLVLVVLPQGDSHGFHVATLADTMLHSLLLQMPGLALEPIEGLPNLLVGPLAFGVAGVLS